MNINLSLKSWREILFFFWHFGTMKLVKVCRYRDLIWGLVASWMQLYLLREGYKLHFIVWLLLFWECVNRLLSENFTFNVMYEIVLWELYIPWQSGFRLKGYSTVRHRQKCTALQSWTSHWIGGNHLVCCHWLIWLLHCNPFVKSIKEEGQPYGNHTPTKKSTR